MRQMNLRGRLIILKRYSQDDQSLYLSLKTKNDIAKAMMSNKIKDHAFSKLQPWVVTKAPEPKEVSAMVEKTKKLMAACALFFSSGL